MRLLIPLLLFAAAAHAAPAGFVDGVSAAGAAGWACLPGAPPVAIAATAGPRLLGVFPTGVPRPDVAGICGTPNAGFQIAFDRATVAQLAGMPSLAFAMLAPGLPPFPLGASGPQATIPDRLPAGAFAPPQNGVLAGALPLPAVHGVRLAAGAPIEDLGLTLPRPRLVPAGGGEVFTTLAPNPTLPPGATLAVFGNAYDAAGWPVPLAPPKVVNQGAATLPLNAHVAQSPAAPGIRNSLATAWLPAGQAIAGVTGQIALTGNAPGFSEALILLGTTADADPAACLQRNGTSTPPPLARIWAGILKNTGAATVSAPVAVIPPYPLPPRSPSGTCAAAMISAGYAYLTGPGPMLTTTDATLELASVPAGPAAPFALGIGGEFRFPVGTPGSLSVYVGMRAVVPLALDAIAGAFSAAPVLNAPPATGWQPAPPAGWHVGTTFYDLPAAACAAAHLKAQPPNGSFAILRQPIPSAMPVPAGAIPLLRLDGPGYDGLAIQKTVFQQFTVPATGRAFVLAQGDCLLGWESTTPGTSSGILDVEDQSTIYLRPAG